MELGHRVLLVPEASREPTTEVEVAIVGSGISGLSAAWRLERQGEPRFLLFELESRAGGTSCYGMDGAVPYPWAAHYLPLPGPDAGTLVELLVEMGEVERRDGQLLPREDSLCRYPQERLFVDGSWWEGLVPIPRLTVADRAEIERFEAQVRTYAGLRDARGRRAFDIPVARSSQDAELLALDRVSAQEWLHRQGFRSKILRWMLEYGCRDDYGCTLQTTSAWALLFYHAARMRDATGPSAPYLTWPEGNGRFVRHIEAVVGDRLKKGHLVLDMVPTDRGVELVVLDARTDRLLRFSARHAILAAPSFLRRYLVRPEREHPPAHLEAFTYSPWMTANLHLSHRPRSRGFPLAWDNVLYGGASLGYVAASHQLLDDIGPTVWTYYHPFTDEDPKRARTRLAFATHRAACDAILSELLPAHRGLQVAVQRIDVWHFGHAMVRPVPGLIWGEALRKAREPEGRLHFASADLSGMPLLEEAHAHGVRAADAILRERRTTMVVP